MQNSIDRYAVTVATMGNESKALDDLKGLDAELIRLQYEGPLSKQAGAGGIWE